MKPGEDERISPPNFTQHDNFIIESCQKNFEGWGVRGKNSRNPPKKYSSLPRNPPFIGQYCKSMQQAVDRAQRSAASLAAVDGTVSAMSWSTVARGRSRAQVRAVRGPESRLERKRSHSGSRKNHGSAAAAASHLSSSKMPAARSSMSRLNITRDHSRCSVSGCTARDKSSHASNDCFNHPLFGEANLARYRERRARRQKST